MSDILPCTKSGSRLLNSLELLLNLLTNKLSIIRNGSYLLILLLNTFTLLSILRIRNYSNNKIHNLEIYTEPDQISTQSAHQLSEYIRIDELIESSVSAYDPLSFIESSTEISSKGVTAILLNWKRTKGLQLIVKQLSRYPFIREIIIFNNNQFVQLYQQVS